MQNKLILNIQFSSQVKFKLAFDASNQKTFADLKTLCVQRLEAFSKLAPQGILETLPSTFDPLQYTLQDASNFILSDQDIVEDLCSNNELINLVFTQSMYIPKEQSAQLLPASKQINSQVVSQVVLSNQQVVNQQPKPQPIVIQPPQSPQVKVTIPQPIKPLQIQNGMMEQLEIEQLKKSFYLDTSKLNMIQQMGGDFEFKIKFLQAEDQTKEYDFVCDLGDLLYDVSIKICQQLGLQGNDYNVVLYGQSGQPIVANLNQLHQKTVGDTINQLTSRVFLACITRTSSGDKTFPKIDSDSGPDQIFIIHQGPKVLKVNIDNTTVLQLKQKIYHKLNIPTNVQSLNYGGKLLQDNLLLKDYNIQNNSNVNLTFKMNQLVGYADSYNYNFYMPWMQHFVKQSDEGIREFRCNSLVLFAKEEVIKMTHTLRQLSNSNNTLTLAVAQLMNRLRLNQTQRIALEEGFIRLFFDLIISSNNVPKTFVTEQILEFSRKWLGFLLKLSTKLVITPEINQMEVYKFIDQQCQVTLQPITIPALLQYSPQEMNVKNWLVVDFKAINEKQGTDEKHSNGLYYKDLKLVQDNKLAEEFQLMKSLDKEQLIWLPQQNYENKPTNSQIPENWHKNEDELQNTSCKIYSSVELKQQPNAPVLTKNALKKLVIYTSMNKDVAKPVNLFDPISGVEQPENPDQMAYNQVMAAYKPATSVSKGMDSDDDSNITVVTQITVEPEEAIIVLIDISGSMDEQFYKSEDLTRLGVVKAFFNAFADRTMAYNLKHVISLVYFDNRYILKCGYTELFMQFKDLVNKATPQGMTALYVALKNATDSLLQFKLKYPNCLLRIIALTDGEDNKGQYAPEYIAQTIVQNNIILDSFVVYDQCDGLKQITKAAGGQCFCPKTIQEGLRLFEYETILQAKIRKPQKPLSKQEVINFFQKHPKSIPFDTEPREIELPVELKKQSINPKQLVRQISRDSQSLHQIAPHIYLKRVMKELMNYEQKPHPFVKVFPCTHDVSFWKVILIGPENTPYFGGIFILYMRFPAEYPVKAPDLRFLTSVYHCNINTQGRICHSILGRNYTPDTRVLQIFEAIYGLLMTPEPDDPLDTTIASEYMQDLALYQKKATDHTAKFAKRPMDEILLEILGQKGEEQELNDDELQEKINEINSWINNSGKPQ